MKNLTEYNKFVKLNKWNRVNEEMDIDTGKAGGGGDMYFANVKGNLAGAENTLVGAAALKLFGFIKRKGLQMYMKKVLKPRLGKAYMNGILRYADKNGLGNFARKLFYSVDKVVDGKAVKFEDQVCFVFKGNNGITSFTQGAEVFKRKSADSDELGEPLEDGKYLLKYNGGIFSVAEGKISDMEEGAEITPTKLEQEGEAQEKKDDDIDINISDDEFDEYKKKIAEDLKKLEEEGVDAEKWVVDECNEVISKIDTNIETIDDDDIKLIKSERNNLLEAVKVLNKGLEEINDVLAKGKDNIANYEDVVYQKLVSTANMNKLLELANFLNKLIVDYTKKTQPEKAQDVKKEEPAVATKVGTEEKKEEPVVVKKESLVFEADEPVVVSDKKLKKQAIAPTKGGKPQVKTARLGDELQEIAARGEAIDLNNKDFYEQFESEEHRQGVTNEILKDKPAIAKIEYDAQRIIGGNEKQQNAWNKMVENVKSMYSKFMDTDKVDPKTIVNSIPEGERKTEEEEHKKSKEGKQTGRIIVKSELESIPLWDESTEAYKNLGKTFKDNDYMVTSLYINNVTNNYIIHRIKTVKDLIFYRVISKIDLNTITENKEAYENGTKEDFSEAVTGKFGKIIGPEEVKKQGGRVVGIYLASRTDLTFGSNSDISIITLYTTEMSGTVNFNKETCFYTIKKNEDPYEELRLPKSPLNKSYAFSKVEIYQEGNWKIKYPNKFGIDTNEKWDIGNAGSVKKLGGIDTIYEKESKK